jgi:hypothetical protein
MVFNAPATPTGINSRETAQEHLQFYTIEKNTFQA